jgi:flagellar hook-length control protein FliK
LILTIVSNISFPAAAGHPGAAQTAGTPGGLQGLLNFLNLAPTGDATQAQAPNAPDLAAKISSLLKNPPAGQKDALQALLKLLQPAGQNSAPPSADMLKQIAALLQNIQPQTTPTSIQPTLTSDLAPASAPVLQNTPDITTPDIQTSQAQTADVQALDAQALNAIEPGSTDVPLDQTLLQQLKQSISDGNLTADTAEKLLKDKGLDTETVKKYMAALDNLLSGKDITANTPQPTAAPFTTPVQPEQVQITTTLKTNTDAAAGIQADSSIAPPTKTQLPLKTDAAATQQPETPQAQAPAPKSSPPVHPSMVNSLASENSGASATVDAGNAQPQMSAQVLDPGTTTGSSVTAPQAGTPGFINYMNAAGGAGTPSPAAQMVSVQLQTNALSKINTMTLQLAPADLGRLDIKLRFDKDGGIRAHLSVDKPETLALLQKDSSHLQRALAQAGFDTDDNTLSFDLRQHGQQQQGAGHAQDDKHGNGGQNYRDAQMNSAMQMQMAIPTPGTISQSGVNIMV